MTLNISSQGHMRTITDVQVVEAAIRQAGGDPGHLWPQLIPDWIARGLAVEEMLAIAGVEQPQRRIA